MRGAAAGLAVCYGATIPAVAQDAPRLPLIGVIVTSGADSGKRVN